VAASPAWSSILTGPNSLHLQAYGEAVAARNTLVDQVDGSEPAVDNEHADREPATEHIVEGEQDAEQEAGGAKEAVGAGAARGVSLALGEGAAVGETGGTR
jgi:hypothetical protein